MKSRVGYPTQNLTLAKLGIRSDRSCKLLDKKPEEVIPQAKELLRQNLADLYKIIEWNIANNIFFFRISSDIAPHISNWRLLPKEKIMDPFALAYDLTEFADDLQRIAELCKTAGHRVTFHPGPFTILNAEKPFTVCSSVRELFWHTRFFDLGGFPLESTLTIHGGGIMGDKPAATARFIRHFNKLPVEIKRRIVLENDEDTFNIDDIYYMSYAIKPYKVRKCIPICFDYFHFQCYNKNYHRDPETYQKQMTIEKVQKILRAQKKELCGEVCPMKMHLSEQNPNLRLGAHSDYIEKIPDWMLEIGIDLMLESKCKELTLLKLRKKGYEI